jgi:hypothetical protein
VKKQSQQQGQDLKRPTKTSERVRMRDLTRRLEAVGLGTSATLELEQLMRARAAVGTGIVYSEMASITESVERVSIETVEELQLANAEMGMEM